MEQKYFIRIYINKRIYSEIIDNLIYVIKNQDFKKAEFYADAYTKLQEWDSNNGAHVTTLNEYFQLIKAISNITQGEYEIFDDGTSIEF